MAKKPGKLRTLTDWLSNRLIQTVLFVLLRLPYNTRVRTTAWLMSRVIAPIAGYRGRIKNNLLLTFPELSGSEVRRMLIAVPENMGRTLIELYSGTEFAARAVDEPLLGPGVAALEESRRTGRPVILITGHIGNYDAGRAALIARGYRVGALYKPMTNRFFNRNYVAAISSIGTPIFPRTRRGLAEMVRFLKSGGVLGLVIDQYMRGGIPLRFIGHDAMTALSAAELALRYDALLVPIYSIRRADGGFDILIEDPVPHTTAIEMTQALNDNLEVQIRRNMDQWLWTHQRWKVAKHNPSTEPD